MISKKELKLSKKFWVEFSNSITTKLLNLSQAINNYNLIRPHKVELRGNIILKIGVSELHEFSNAQGVPILVIPSMINKAYIMDLPGSSFIDSLRAQGFKVYVIEWGNPAVEEEKMDLNDYIKRIDKFADYLIRITGSQLILLGYCMGGVMASFYACKYAEKVKSVVHLGTPWDFNLTSFIKLNPDKVMKLFDNRKNIPKDFFQFSFYISKFADINRKYLEFKKQKLKNSNLLYIEYWLNDGVDMPKGVFRQFIDNIVYKNELTSGKLNLGKIIYNIDSCLIPTLSVIATKDSLIPVSSGEAIKFIKPELDLVYFDTGHVGLVTKIREDIAETIRLWHFAKTT